VRRCSRFGPAFAASADLETLRHIEAVFDGDARSLLDFPERPEAYDDAGHEWNWNRRRMRHWPRSAYEEGDSSRHRATADPDRGKRHVAERMQGWYEVMFREPRPARAGSSISIIWRN